MLKICVLFPLLILSNHLISQNSIINIQNFDEPDNEWNFTTDISFFDHQSDGFFGIHDGDSDNDPNDTGIALKANGINSSNIHDDFLFVNDLHDEGDNGTHLYATIFFDDINISNYHNVILSFDYEIFEFEASDYFLFEIFEDGKSVEIADLPKNNEGSISYPIKNRSKLVSINFIIKQNGVEDFCALDNVKLEGQEIIPCSEIMITEYVEGTSSRQHRNNFIEIYNPSNTSISLNDYTLVKYTGKSQEVSISLNIQGVIPPLGTFLIEDVNENLNIAADISTNSSVMDYNGDDKIGLRKHNEMIDLIGVIGDSINFAKDITLRRKSGVQQPNNQFNPEEWEVYTLENLDDINHHLTSCNGPIPEIELSGNATPIVDGSLTTSSINNTYFGMIGLNSEEPISKTFLIKNTGQFDLYVSLTISGADVSDYSLLANPDSIIHPQDSSEFKISFNPISLGLKTAEISINNNDASENPFNFLIQGEGTGVTSSALMITQYYEGAANNKWLEITNISQQETDEYSYYLAMYWNDDAKHPMGKKPSRSIQIPRLIPGQSVLFRSTLTVLKPDYALNLNPIKSSVCGFTGDDIIIISTSNDINCWQYRLDIIGESANWGANISYIRKYGCLEVSTNTGFKKDDWLITDIEKVDNAAFDTNEKIGIHHLGITSYIAPNTWNNGLPDLYRGTTIDHDFKSSFGGNLETCHLIINPGVHVDIEPNHYLLITENLEVNGTLNIEHEGSLIMINDDGYIENNGEINVHKATTPLKKYDYTYWSSPVKNAHLEHVFYDSPEESFYAFSTLQFADTNHDGIDDDPEQDAWQSVYGIMNIGKGYTAMAPHSIKSGASQEVIFNGIVNNGMYRVPIFLSADDFNENEDWNLIGNPYASAIEADLLFSNPGNRDFINGSFYFWTHDTAFDMEGDKKRYSSDDYSIYNIGTGGVAAHPDGIIPTGKIASCQGFFVEAVQEGSIEFNNSMRVQTGNNNFFKSVKKKMGKDRIWLNLFNEEGAFSQILLGFIQGASSAYESEFDAIRMEGSHVISFYMPTENKRLAIQGLPSFDGNKSIPLGFSTKNVGQMELKIGIGMIEGRLNGRPIYLFDSLLNIIHDLTKSHYKFMIEKKGIYNNRFSLKFNKSGLLGNRDEIDREKLLVYFEGQSLIISTNKLSMIQKVVIYDLLGRIVKETDSNRTVVRLEDENFNGTGFYIVRTTLNDSQVLSKKIIK